MIPAENKEKKDSASKTKTELPDPDGKDADMDQPVQVYILMGQSNMLGFGSIGSLTEKAKETETPKKAEATTKKGKKKKKNKKKKKPKKKKVTLADSCKIKKLYPYLIDDKGNWTVRKDVRNVSFIGGGKKKTAAHNEWMTVTGKTFGPEFGIGHHVGNDFGTNCNTS